MNDVTIAASPLLATAADFAWRWMSAMAWQVALLVALLFVLTWLLRKATSARFRYALWMLVPVRLILPPTLALATGWAWWCLPAQTSAEVAESSARPGAPHVTNASGLGPGMGPGWPFPGEVEDARHREDSSSSREDGAPLVVDSDHPPSASPSSEKRTVAPVVTSAPADTEPTTSAPAAASEPLSFAWLTQAWKAWLFLAWLVGVTWLLARLARGWLQVRTLVRAAGPCPDTVAALARACHQQVGLRREVRVMVSAGVTSPMLVGVVRPVILLPSDIERHLDEEEFRTVLIHELQHVRRRDPLTSLLVSVLVAIYWFHPAVWLFQWKLRRLRELACDESTVAALSGARKSYATGLVKVAEMITQGQPAPAIGFLERKSDMKTRVMQILDARMRVGRGLSFAGLAAVVIIGLILVPGAAQSSGQQDGTNDASVNRTDAETSASSAGPQDAQEFISEDGKIAIHGVVYLPDGSPAAGAEVAMKAMRNEQPIHRTTADEQGRFRFEDVPPYKLQVQASTADREWMGATDIADFRLRSTVGQSFDVQLKESVKFPVIVATYGGPVAGAWANVHGTHFDAVQTDEDGYAEISIVDNPWQTPQTTFISAFHPKLGVGGIVPVAAGVATPIELVKPAPREVRVVDEQNQPVPNFEFTFSNIVLGDAARRRTFAGASIHQSALRTDGDGEVICPWMPARDFHSVHSYGTPEWKCEEVDYDAESDAPLVVHVSKFQTVEGKVNLPDGVDARGLLVAADGYKRGGRGGREPAARCASDGSFRIPVEAGYTYAVGIMDDKWASDLHNGMLLSEEGSETSELTLEAYPATPVKIVATHGPDQAVVDRCFVTISARHNFFLRWKEPDGSPFVAGGAPQFRASGTGDQTIYVGRDEFELQFGSPDWFETRTFTVDSEEPQTIEFHRPWVGERTFAAELQLNGKPVELSKSAIVRGWTGESPYDQEYFAGEITGGSKAWLATRATYMTMAVVDPERKLAGVLTIDEETDEAQTLELQPTAAMSGVVTSHGAPVAGKELRLAFAHYGVFGHIAREERTFLDDVTTDEQGRFRFDGIPSNSAIRLFLRDSGGRWERSRETYMFAFEPDEVRSNLKIEMNPTRPAAPQLNAEQRVELRLRDARLNRLPALLVLTGPDAPQAAHVTRQLLDHAEFPEVLSFLPRTFTPQDVDNIALARRGWNQPGANQFSLIVVGSAGETLGQITFGASSATALEDSKAFLREHVPPARSGSEQLADALADARRTDRNVCLILGGARCGPCFLLARWLEDHHELFEKDFVVLKLVGPADDETDVIMQQYRPRGHSIPYTVLIAPDGSRIADSEGPLGNTGFPSSLEGIRHFRKMLRKGAKRMTDAELDALMEALKR